MARTEPNPAQVEKDIGDLLWEQEVGALGVLGPDGAPAVSMMHFAADGLVVYLHTFTYARKYAAIQRDSRVSYTLASVPPEGFDGRDQLRAIQVEGIASFVTDPGEIERAIQVSREQFAWLKDTTMFDTFAKGTAHHQAFFRIDPVEALWNDNRVRRQWRKIVSFTPDHRHVARLAPYPTKAQPPAANP
ncbi:hypothetical protein A5761_01665 [Mycolicibacterium setense]|uniref:pyridoxamine 5'-phosphate oxidase family protein n=1 Tax=Mycolicibacterium setense TaxID=431269 RepID=UPI0007EA3EB8|nr:pyridoxamine 5'-phosphate oxidase family protein [Mycolicibacterium setense]OBB14632.1 hypothetical protein A5761_01665 [Mycolicibacterium setense]